MTRGAMIEKLELALNEALLGRGITLAHTQRNYRLNTADAMRLHALRDACFDALGMLAALSRPAPPDDLVAVTRTQLAEIQWAGRSNEEPCCPVCGLVEEYAYANPEHPGYCWLAAALAAPAPVAAPAPETPAAEPECAGPFVSAFDCPKCDPRRRKPAPETPAPDAMPTEHEPYCRECGADGKRVVYVEAHADSDEWRCKDCGHTFSWRRQESQP